MRLEVEIELIDAPGSLAAVLDRIAASGGNIQSVVHKHEQRDGNAVPVVVAVEVPEDAAVALIGGLAKDHRILRVDQEGGPAHAAVVLTGHVFQARLDQIIDKVFESGARVEQVDARIAGQDRPSAAWLQLTAEDRGTLRQALASLRAVCQASGVGVIDAVEVSDA